MPPTDSARIQQTNAGQSFSSANHSADRSVETVARFSSAGLARKFHAELSFLDVGRGVTKTCYEDSLSHYMVYCPESDGCSLTDPHH